MAKDRTIAETYSQLLAGHVEQPSERYLAEAADLGKQLVQTGIPVEAVVEIHEGALASLARARPGLALKDAAISATQPLMELFMAYGLAFRRQLAEGMSANEALRAEMVRRRHVEAALEARTRELQRSNVELAQFASVVSHDLRSPLQTISGFAELLGERYRDTLDPKAVEMLDHVVDGARRMEALISDLLRLSRVGHGELDAQPVDLGQVLEGVRTDVAGELGRRAATLTWDPLPVVPADAGQMTQLLENLVGNGLKFSGDKPPRIHVSATPDNGFWVISVRDEGIGIAPAHRDDIFEMFRRLHTDSQIPGTGIGLAICKKIVERHHGRIWVESEPGRGSTFRFTLPAASGTGDPAGEKAGEPAEARPTAGWKPSS